MKTPCDAQKRVSSSESSMPPRLLAYIKRLMRSQAGRRATILLLTAAVAAATAHPKSWYESIFTIYQQLRHHLSPHRKIQQGVCNRPAPSDVTMTWNHSIIDIDMDGRLGYDSDRDVGQYVDIGVGVCVCCVMVISRQIFVPCSLAILYFNINV